MLLALSLFFSLYRANLVTPTIAIYIHSLTIFFRYGPRTANVRTLTDNEAPRCTASVSAFALPELPNSSPTDEASADSFNLYIRLLAVVALFAGLINIWALTPLLDMFLEWRNPSVTKVQRKFWYSLLCLVTLVPLPVGGVYFANALAKVT